MKLQPREMKAATIILLMEAMPAAAQWKCLPDKPTSIGDLMRKWQTIDKTTRPNLAARSAEIRATAEGDGEPPVAAAEDVYVSLQVNKLIAVDTKAQTVTTEVWWRVIWNDTRLAYDPDCLQLDSVGAISRPRSDFSPFLWKPDLYSPQDAVEEPDVLNDAVWIWPNGKVWWLRKIFWTIECAMSFEFMPFDTQRCEFQIAGFSQETDEINLLVPDGSPRFLGLKGAFQPVCISEAGTIEYDLTDLHGRRSGAGEIGQSLDSDLVSLVYQIDITRNPSFYGRYFILPMVLVVLTAYLSFWISRAAAPARTGMVVITFLALTGMMNSTFAFLPKLVGFVWLLSLQQASLFFVMGAMLEYAAVNYLFRMQIRIERAVDAAKKRMADGRIPTACTDDVSPRVSATQSNRGDGRGHGGDGDGGGGDRARGGGDEGGVGREDGLGGHVVEVATEKDAPGDKDLLREVQTTVGPVERLLLRPSKSGDDVRMRLKDEHLDVFCRYAFPAAYAITLLAFYVMLPQTPEQALELRDVCTDGNG